MEDPGTMIKCTLSYLNNTKSYTSAFKKNVIEAFEARLITEEQFTYMIHHVTKFIKKIEVYENMFLDIYDKHFISKQ
ncbi:hypothetical protein [Ehrlichia canis]|uniref:Uncharacterized protein n=1 Tax=Ehrlichia canis (strain Jake) TaxID=269484 RepID=A0ACA6AVP5_EHRCJ|nr:hypothetical protein [Ehrlichia canis]AAZ68443.1 hypothetical protein Ecaj_0400 [Ehrlichia canis str. Jake]AUO54805.1 hypothetical protein C1I72_02810 [Ehrlichia canis]UKC53851.1 hypothetical protein s20019040002_000896 [Ehrlichia canis]UKC54787.1 hypothetical protein s20026770001_000895 [Ehrlichia canis]UKC55723.1 hypothetical protein s21009500007_000895 [Ehrlichia canis]